MNAIFGKKIKKDVKSLPKVDVVDITPVFGVSLAEAISRSRCYDGVPVPLIVRKCIDYVTLHGMLLEGIYRISAPKAKLDELERIANSGAEKELRFTDAHEASGVLKRYLRQLPEHLLTEKLKSKFDSVSSQCKCPALCSCSCVQELKDLMKNLPRENYYLLAYIFIHAQAVIAQQKFNKMGLSALGVLLQATLNLSKNQVRIFLLNAATFSYNEGAGNMSIKLFEDVDYKPYLTPKCLHELQADLPTGKNELQEELYKQQNLLDHLLTDQIPNNSLREQEVRDVQEAIKILIHKLKSMQIHLDTSQVDLAESATQSVTKHYSQQGIISFSVNSMLLEKQLIAIQSSLKDEIATEKRNIVQLLTRLREIHSQLPAEALDKLNSHRLSQQVEKISLPASNGISDGNSTNTEGALERKEELIKEVVRLRNLCAQLRARLEEDSVLLNATICKQTKVQQPALDTSAQLVQKRQEEAAASLLVTRF